MHLGSKLVKSALETLTIFTPLTLHTNLRETHPRSCIRLVNVSLRVKRQLRRQAVLLQPIF